MIAFLQAIDLSIYQFFSPHSFGYATQKEIHFENQALTNNFNLHTQLTSGIAWLIGYSLDSYVDSCFSILMISSLRTLYSKEDIHTPKIDKPIIAG